MTMTMTRDELISLLRRELAHVVYTDEPTRGEDDDGDPIPVPNAVGVDGVVDLASLANAILVALK